MYYISLCLYYLIGRFIPNKFKGVEIRRFLCKYIFAEVGKDIYIAENVVFGSGRFIHMSRNSRLGKNCKLYGPGRIYIGSYNVMGSDVMIITGDHKISKDDDRLMAFSKEVYIGSNTYIGSRATILKGVSISDNSVIGACTLVNRDIPPNEMHCGVPAKFVKRV